MKGKTGFGLFIYLFTNKLFTKLIIVLIGHMHTDQAKLTISSQDLSKIELDEQTEYLLEVIESQKRYLDYQEKQLLETQEMLRLANKEIDDLNQEMQSLFLQELTTVSSQNLTLDEAKQLAKTLLASGIPTQDALEQLICGIYGSCVAIGEPGQTQTPLPNEFHPTVTNLQQSCAEYQQSSIEFKDQFDELGVQYLMLKALFKKFKAQYDQRMNQKNPKILKHPSGKSRFAARVLED